MPASPLDTPEDPGLPGCQADPPPNATVQALHDCIERWLPTAISRLLGRRRLPEDIIQEAILHAYEIGRRMIRGDLRGRYQPEGKPLTQFRAILVTVAWNKARDLLRPRKRGIKLASLPADDLLASAAAGPAEALARNAVWQGLDRLGAADRELIVARYVEELTMRACARRFGIPEATFRRRLDRALVRLKAVYMRLA
jgi:RNA polymerase sigma-70 factor (ECF subfamily)